MSLETTKPGQNISNAVEVLRETYKNLEMFFAELDRIGEEEGFVSLTPRFMRWKSDSDSSGWLTSNFIKLYQLDGDIALPNLPDMKVGSLYGVEVDLIEEGYPVISLVRYTFDYSSWSRIPTVSDHWIFYGPFRYDNLFDISEENGLWTSVPFQKSKKRYWDIQKVVARAIPLMDITSPEEIRIKIFQELGKLPE